VSLAVVGGVQSVYSVQKIKSLPRLHRAVVKGNLPKAKKLSLRMKTGELNATDKEKRTALHYACAGGQEETVAHLCSELRADPNVRDSSGCTPLHRVSISRYNYTNPLKELFMRL
jgi:ankyrin repeat protein